MLKKYEYISEEERVFPTLGISCNKGDTFECDFTINSPHVKEIDNSSEAPNVEDNQNSIPEGNMSTESVSEENSDNLKGVVE